MYLPPHSSCTVSCVFQFVAVLQCVAVCCIVLQCVAVCCSVLHNQFEALVCNVPLLPPTSHVGLCVLQSGAVCFSSVLQRVAVCCIVLQCVA